MEWSLLPEAARPLTGWDPASVSDVEMTASGER